MASVTKVANVIPGSVVPAGLSAVLRREDVKMVVLADSARSLYHDILQALVARVEGKQPLWLFVMLSPVCVLQVLVSKDSCLSGEGEAQVMWCWQDKEDDQ